MLKVSVYNQEGKKIKDRTMSSSVFEVPMKKDLVWHAINAFLANTRRSTAKTKDKSERRGGGRKPWKQKGTGRARHGSIRSPLWRKGGVTFGPTPDINHTQKINKVAKRKALCMILSDKALDQKLIILDSLEIKQLKTKSVAALLAKLPAKERSTLFVTADKNDMLFKSQRNLPQTKSVLANQINVYDAGSYEYILVDEKSVEAWEQLYAMPEKAEKKGK